MLRDLGFPETPDLGPSLSLIQRSYTVTIFVLFVLPLLVLALAIAGYILTKPRGVNQ